MKYSAKHYHAYVVYITAPVGITIEHCDKLETQIRTNSASANYKIDPLCIVLQTNKMYI